MSGLPAFKAAGAMTGGASTWATVAWPAGHAVGDFGLLVFAHRNITSVVPNNPSGWVVIPHVNDGVSPGFQLACYYRVATSTSEANVTMTGSNGNNAGVIVTYTGVNVDTPLHAIVPCNAAAVSGAGHLYIGGGTSVLPNCLVVLVSTYGTTNAAPVTNTITNAGLSSLSTRVDANNFVAAGSYMGALVYDGGLATSGTINFTDALMLYSSGARNSTNTLFLQSTDNALPTLFDKGRIVMAGM